MASTAALVNLPFIQYLIRTAIVLQAFRKLICVRPRPVSWIPL
jgi:hypothetical protein